MPAVIPPRSRVGGDADGSGSASRGRVPVPLRSQSEHPGGGAVRTGSVETVRREERHGEEAAAEPAGRRRARVGAGGGSDATQQLTSETAPEPAKAQRTSPGSGPGHMTKRIGISPSSDSLENRLKVQIRVLILVLTHYGVRRNQSSALNKTLLV